VNFDPDLDPAPPDFRNQFAGQALKHLDEFVTSWRSGGHPIEWSQAVAMFDVYLLEGPETLFRIYSPGDGKSARVEVDIGDAANRGIPSDLAHRLWLELADIGKVKENPYVPLSVSLGKFSRGDRKVFLAYALTIARQIARPPDDIIFPPDEPDESETES